MERKESEVKRLRCLKCGGDYIYNKGTLKDLEFCKLKITVKDVEYYKCSKCGRLLFPSETAERIEKEFKEAKKKYKGV